MRIAIFGAGGAGGYFGARLARAGEDVTFIARGDHLRAILSRGLRVTTPEEVIHIHPARAVGSPGEAGAADVVLLGVKAWQVTDAAKAMSPLIGAGTCVVPLQNGVEASSQLAGVLGAERVLGGLCGTISWVASPGVIRSLGTIHFVKFGELSNTRSARVERLRAAFEKAGVKVEIPVDVEAALWEKFLFVVPVGGIGAVARAPIGVTRSRPETRRLLERGMREVLAVGRARGVSLAEETVERALELVDSLAPDGTSSLQRDIETGRPSELEAWSGAVVRLGREVGTPTPLHEFIYSSLLPLELRARGELDFPR